MAEHVFEYELAEDALAITLLRCVGTISRDVLPTRAVVAGPDVPTPEAQMLGRTELSIGVFLGAPADPVRAWESFALPAMTTPAEGGGTLPGQGSLLDIDAPALSSVRRVDGRLSVRVWNPGGRPVRARVGSSSLELGPHRIESVYP
jgi:mannosylglycerate hydrolase